MTWAYICDHIFQKALSPHFCKYCSLHQKNVSVVQHLQLMKGWDKACPSTYSTVTLNCMMFTAMKFFQTGVVMSSQPPSLWALLLLFCFIDDRVFSQQLPVWYNWFCESLSWVCREIANILISSVCAFWVICFVDAFWVICFIDAQIVYFSTLFFSNACFADIFNSKMRERFGQTLEMDFLLPSLGGRVASGTRGYCPTDFDHGSLWFSPRNT